MSSKDSEYRPTSSSCGYSRLSCYNPTSATMAQALPSAGQQIIPTYDAPGYNTLQHGSMGASCGGHFSYSDAYGASKGCTQNYNTRACDSCDVKK